MDFGTAIKTLWKKYATFEGRARRSEFWFIYLFLFLTSIGAAVIDSVLFEVDLYYVTNFGFGLGFSFVEMLWFLATLLPSLSVTARRLHDTNRSGWWQLIVLVPLAVIVVVPPTVIRSVTLAMLAGLIVLLVFTLQDSTPGKNKYGASPKESNTLS